MARRASRWRLWLEPELLGLVTLALVAAVSKAVRPRARHGARDAPRSAEARIRVCIHGARAGDAGEVVQRFVRTCSNRFELHFGILVECTSVDDVVSALDGGAYPRERVIVHHTTRVGGDAHHYRRRRKMVRRFVNGLEDMVVLADARVHPEHGWDVTLMGAVRDGAVVTCPLCPHAAGFPTMRRRSTGDVVRDEARPFVNPGDVGTFVASVCVCDEFVACHPHAVPLGPTTASVLVPTFPVVRPVPVDTEGDVLDDAMQTLASTLTASQRLGLSAAPDGLEMYHKYGSTSAARIALKLDRRRPGDG